MKIWQRLTSSDGLMAAALFVGALLVRLIYLAEIQALPTTHHLGLDAASYDRLARDIAGGRWLGDGIFYQAPLYPYFLALFYKVFGHHLNLVRLVQLILGAFNCVVLAWMARKLFDRRTAFWVGGGVVGYGILVFYEGAIGKDGISVLLTDLVLLGLVYSLEKRVWYGWVLSGAALGCAILTRGNLLLLAPLVVLWMLVVLRGEPLKGIVGPMGAVALGTCLFVFPVTVRNYVVGRDFVLTTAQAGQNFYIGNNPRASGFFENPKNIRLNPKYEEADFKAEALRRTKRSDMKPSELSSFWFREGFRFIRTHPEKALELLLRKTAMFWNAFEIPDNYNYYFVRREVFVLPALFVGFGMVAPLGLMGLYLARRKPVTWLFILFTMGYMISIVPFHVASRYRLPIVPVLILFSGHTVTCLLDTVRSRRFRRLALGAVPVALVTVFINWPVVDEDDTFKMPLTELGIIAAEGGDPNKAMKYYEEALDIDPDFAPAHYNMGNALADQGRFEEAIAAYKETLRRDPEFLMAYENLGKSYIRTDRFEEALSTFDKALGRRPDFAEAYVGKGLVHHMRGDYMGAVRLYGEALEIRPDLASAFYNLACAHGRLGTLEEARQALDEAIALNPAFENKARTDPDLAGVMDGK